MSAKLDRKFLFLLVLKDFFVLEHHADPNPEKEIKTQNRRIQKLMKSAYEIPFYRARFEKAGLKPSDFKTSDDLQKFPLLTKAELREWISEESGKAKYKDYYLDATSGSSGIPTKVLYSPREKAWNIANWLRVMVKFGYNPFLGLTACRKSGHSVSTSYKSFVQKIGILRRVFVNQYAAEPDVIEEIKALKPDFLYLNKTELMRVALYSVSHDLPVFQPRFFCPTGEKIDESASKILRQVFGPNLIDAFGTAETGSVMLKLPDNDYYRVHSDLFAVNVFDENNTPALTGKLAVTPLYKTDIPLINYLVGDTATVGEKNGVRVVQELQGRTSDFIRHENGEVTTFFMIIPAFYSCKELLQMRMIQTSYQNLTVQAVLDKTSSKSKEEVAEALIEKMQSRLKQPMNITFEWMDVIPPDPNGKLRLIVNRME